MQDLAQFIATHLALTYTLAITLVVLMTIEFMRARRNQTSIDVARAVQLINRENAVVIDIRSSEQYKKGHIIDSRSLMAKDMMLDTKVIEKFKKRPIVVVCATGFDSQKMAAFLIRHGYNAFALSGGVRSWSEAELPLIKQ